MFLLLQIVLLCKKIGELSIGLTIIRENAFIHAEIIEKIDMRLRPEQCLVVVLAVKVNEHVARFF